jgi:hypothetical protein
MNPFQSEAPSQHDVPAADSSGDPLGLASWAASCGLETHTALALASGILAGIAGPLARLPVKAPCAFPGVNMTGREDDHLLRMAIQSAVGFLLAVEEATIAKTRELTSEEVDAVMFESGRRRSAKDLVKLGEPGPLDSHFADSSSLARLDADTGVSDQLIRYEALARARFILSGRPPQSLVKLLSNFHFGQGLLAGAIESLPRDASKRKLRLDEYLRGFAGTQASPAPSGKRYKITPDSVGLKGILLFPPDQFDWLISHQRPFLSQAIPVASSPDAGLAEVDEYRAAHFIKQFKQKAYHALAARRVYSAVITEFHSDAAILDFASKQRLFLRELQGLPEDLRIASAASLPATMAWALLWLSGRDDRDAYVLETAFTSARRMVEDARTLFLKHDQAALGETRMRNAKKWHARLAKTGPSPRWELLRGFDQQSLSIHAPVIRVLIEMKIIKQDENNLLHLGSEPLHRLSLQNLIDID